MADADLRYLPDLRALVPAEAMEAFTLGDERWAATLLARARDGHQPGSLAWAVLERLLGLTLIHVLREVEGTFALERADPVLDAAGVPRPTLAWLGTDILGDDGPLESP
ncbi:hypothetical protein GCM10008955_24390 [Deinococcus malanensis]|uniref:Uncharacterized protein n=1 Tax=Deinococcus malanensis TaxID=1706855 RepID=A0ABQ2EZG6_9DEIO|nr:hypothetical protein [Deinococcus malanensis]GGK29711.1 hypothetical protein GCM10008955_24390 [Deinococcus malanensis]